MTQRRYGRMNEKKNSVSLHFSLSNKIVGYLWLGM